MNRKVRLRRSPIRKSRAKARKKGVQKKREAVKVFADGREVCNLETAAGKREYGQRLEQMIMRQHGYCCLCGEWLRPMDATFDHEDGRGMGGARRDDRIVLPNGTWINGAAHEWCNNEKGSRRIAYNFRFQPAAVSDPKGA
jgi:hypothetical protein